jgi:hypothetical protein
MLFHDAMYANTSRKHLRFWDSMYSKALRIIIQGQGHSKSRAIAYQRDAWFILRVVLTAGFHPPLKY